MRREIESGAPARRNGARWLRGGWIMFGALVLAGWLGAGCAARNYPGPVHGLKFDGTIQSVDRSEHRLVLAPLKPGPPVVFIYDASTKFWKNDLPIHVEDLEAGKSARVHYHLENGQMVAHHVYMQVPYASH